MPEITPAPGDRTIVIHRPGVLTWISLAFNALILLLILIGIVNDHHRHDRLQPGGPGGPHERMDRGGGRGDFDRCDASRMHHEWRHHDFGGPREEDRGPDDDDQRGPGMDERHDWAGDKPGFGPGDFHGPEHKPMTPPSSEAMTDRFMLMMTDKLALTDEESAQIRPIVQGQITQFQKDMEAQKAAHQKMIDDAKAKIRPILTPDQQKQFDQLTAGIGAPLPEKAASK